MILSSPHQNNSLPRISANIRGARTRKLMVAASAEADLESMMKERQSAVYWPRQPRPGSLFAAVDNKSRWLFAVPYDPDTEPGRFADRQSLPGVGPRWPR